MFLLSNEPINPFVGIGSRDKGNKIFWNWGSDNIFPYALALMARSSATHRRVINDKTDYISGKGFSYDEKNTELEKLIKYANSENESLHKVINKLAFDINMFGNGFLEIVTDRKKSFLSIFHQDATTVRLHADNQHVWISSDWCQFVENKAKQLPLYPLFEQHDHFMRSVIHFKKYEPMFQHYGVPAYIAGLGVSEIAYKTDKWNISRLDNSFQMSGVLIVDASCETEEDAKKIKKEATKEFAGKPGKVLFLFANDFEGKGATFTPIQSNNEGDWKDLHEQATSDIVVAHSWFRTLSGLDYSTGFSPERILHEYEIALSTVILKHQSEIIDPVIEVIQNIVKIDCSTLSFINKPPITVKPAYMKIWEARKYDGLPYDENDPDQQKYLAELNKSKEK
jgi:predicted MPP superfamily phosphohydrolase